MSGTPTEAAVGGGEGRRGGKGKGGGRGRGRGARRGEARQARLEGRQEPVARPAYKRKGTAEKRGERGERGERGQARAARREAGGRAAPLSTGAPYPLKVCVGRSRDCIVSLSSGTHRPISYTALK